jgi:hypothetical protein
LPKRYLFGFGASHVEARYMRVSSFSHSGGDVLWGVARLSIPEANRIGEMLADGFIQARNDGATDIALSLKAACLELAAAIIRAMRWHRAAGAS